MLPNCSDGVPFTRPRSVGDASDGADVVEMDRLLRQKLSTGATGKSESSRKCYSESDTVNHKFTIVYREADASH